MSTTYPNFVMIGPPKSGSTSLYHYLKQHPDIYLSAVKEPRYFLFDQNDPEKYRGFRPDRPEMKCISDPDKYQALFHGVQGEKAVGEASARYLISPEAAPRMRDHNPAMKLITVLRQPADRAHSNFWWRKTSTDEKAETFAEAVEEELSGARDNWFHGRYIAGGYYARFLKHYLGFFPRDQIQIHLFEDFTGHPIQACQHIFEFLGVDPSFVPETEKAWYKSGRFSNPVHQKIWDASRGLRDAARPFVPLRLRGWAFEKATAGMKRVPFDPSLRARLNDLYREDILELQDLLGRDLSHWLKTT